jgi:hypothetical protein
MAVQCKDSSRSVNVLITQDLMTDCRLAHQIVDHLKSRSSIKIRTLTWRSFQGTEEVWVIQDERTKKTSHMTPDQLVEWADLLVVACLGAGSLSKMLHGETDGFLLEVLRSWDVSKKIILIPGMTVAMWENPMTKKQMNKIRRRWNWIRVLDPILWHGKASLNAIQEWPAMDDLIQGVHNQADLISIGHDVETIPSNFQQMAINPLLHGSKLPSEIWSLIMEYVGDWEVAKSLGVYTNLPIPLEWRAFEARALSSTIDLQPTSDLESTILLGNYSQTVGWFKRHPTPKWLSKPCVKLIIKFALTDLLSYLESYHKDLFWSTFGHTLLPTKASAVFGRIAILDWWHTSPSFLTKEYNAEALDSASKAGFIHILDWWRNSGLPLRYTEAALEQASSRGNLEVLDWWRNASLPQNDRDDDNAQFSPTSPTTTDFQTETSTAKASSATTKTQQPLPLRLKVGKSIIYAAQNGQAATLQWWVNSGISFAHEEPVARIASAHGHVNVLQLWKNCRGQKMQYDHQVLVGPTKNGHVEVLEWWKQSEYTVEYKTCDIEEALEDSVGGIGEDSIRAWWARNGLNLGVGTSEWMKVKTL